MPRESICDPVIDIKAQNHKTQNTNNHTGIRNTRTNTVIIITLFESQIILGEHDCCTHWGDCKSNKSNQMLVFAEERGKPEFPEKNLSEQSREPTSYVIVEIGPKSTLYLSELKCFIYTKALHTIGYVLKLECR